MNLLTIALFIIGFGVLIKGADLLVEGASLFGRRLGMSELVIGLTIVAFGTSAPELFVNVISAVSGTTDLALGNILGSNIANVFLILGVAAIIYPIAVSKNTVFKEIPYALLGAVVVMMLAVDYFSGGANFLTFNDGIVLFGFFGIYMYYIVSQTREIPAEPVVSEKPVSNLRALAWIALGLTGLILGGKWIVDGALLIASMFNMSERMIGLTIVALGTSLPELATSIVAALKKKGDLVIGNVIGSSIFNTLWILGITSIIQPIAIVTESTWSFIINIGSMALLLAFLFVGNRAHVLKRWHGIVFVGIYIAIIIGSVYGVL